MIEVMMGIRTGLTAGERTIIDRCVHKVYAKWKINAITENIPLLQDLWVAIKEINDPEAENIAKAMELYVTGSMNIFNHKTNVDINNRFICYDIKELVSNVKQLGMLIVQDAVWNKVTVNRSQSKKTWYYLDEFHLLLKDAETAKYTVEVYKRFRKWGGIPTAMTQNVKDLLKNDQIENILENARFIVLLNQGPGDRAIIGNRLNISKHQLDYVKDVDQGEGLIICDGTIIPFIDKFPKDTTLYKLMTTKPNEMLPM